MLNRTWLTLITLSAIAVFQSAPCHAQGFVEHFEPPVLERGKTTRVTVIGSRLGKAQGLWTSLAAGAVKAVPVGPQTPGQAVLDVTVAGDAPVGIHGMRLATDDGLANACLELIDDLPVRPVVTDKPAVTPLPAALWGRFREAKVDRFLIDVKAGQRVSFEAVGNRFGKDIDPLLIIRDAKGRIVAERDNDPGLYFDFRFEHVFAAAGTYTVEMRDARFHGSEHGLYVLRMGRFPAARVGLPLTVAPGKRAQLRLPELAGAVVDVDVPKETGPFMAVLRRADDDGSAWLPLEVAEADVTVHQAPGLTLEDGTLAKVPGMLCGVLDKPGQKHFFRLELAKGQRLQIRAEARAFNSPADLELAVTDAKGKELRRVGENQQKEEIILDFNAGNPGIYGLTVRDVNRDGGPAFAYRLEVRSTAPGTITMPHIAAEVEGLTVPRGDYQPIPLVITREPGSFAGKIALTLEGAEPGLTLTPNEIAEGVNTVVGKLSAASDAPLGIRTVRILAMAKVDDAKIAVPVALPVRTRPLIDRQIVNVDLIPYALREDQRRLPPALTDRFAVQITPPAPFSVELPEPMVTLGRYQHVEFPVVTTRQPGFAGPITFRAKGGQIAPKEEGRTRVYAEFPEAKLDRLKINGSIHSKILTNLTKHRVEVTAKGVHEGRSVSLTRTFDLDIRGAFTISAEPATMKMTPGTSMKVRLHAGRLTTFDSDVTVQLAPAPGLNLPDKIVIPRGQAGVDLDVQVTVDRAPGRQSISMTATADVNGFEEEQRSRLEIDIVKPPVPKK